MTFDPPTFDQTGMLIAMRLLSSFELAFEQNAADLAEEHHKKNLIRICDDLEIRCRKLGIQASVAHIDRIRFEFPHAGITYGELYRLSEGLRQRIEDELRAINFLYVPLHRAGLYADPLNGRKDVVDAFPSVRDDLVESSKCYALGRFTGSVFHLMRALEPCLGAVSKELGVMKHSPTWNAYLSAFPNAIAAKYPAKNATDGEMRIFYSGVTQNLASIKDAWRNPTMHSIAATYDERQALDVRNSVGAFMRHLATKLKE